MILFIHKSSFYIVKITDTNILVQCLKCCVAVYVGMYLSLDFVERSTILKVFCLS